jgi:hypothetical protein
MSGSNALSAPVGARMIVLAERLKSATAGYVTASIPAWPKKDPTEILVYGVDFVARVEGRASIARVASIQPGITPANGVTVSAGLFLGTQVWFEASGGVDKTDVYVPIKVQLTDGQVLVSECLLPICSFAGASQLPGFGGSYLTFRGSRITVNGSRQTVANGYTPPSNSDFVNDPISGLVITDPISGLPIGAPA